MIKNLNIKNKKLKTLLILGLIFIVIGLLSNLTFALQATVDPTRMVLGARPLGMGRAFTGIVNDANAVFINPAGLTQLRFPALSGTSKKIFFDETLFTQYMFAFPHDWGYFGLGYTDANVGGSFPTYIDPISGKIAVNPSLEAISYDNYVLTLSYANKAAQNISWGTNLKIFNQSMSGGGLNGMGGRGFGLDLGLLYFPYQWLSIGGTYQNLGATVQWNNTNKTQETVGSQVKLGVGINLLGTPESSLYQYGEQVVKVAVDLDMPMQGLLAQSNTMLYHLGAEWFPVKDLAIRAGYDQDYGAPGADGTIGNLCFGIGFTKAGFQFDYAYYPGTGAGAGEKNPHYFSLSYVGFELPPPPPTQEAKVEVFTKKQEYKLAITSPRNRSLTPKLSLPVLGHESQLWEVYALTTTQEVETIEIISEEAGTELSGEEIENLISNPTLETEATGSPETVVTPTKATVTVEVITRTVTKEISTLVTREAGPIPNAIVRIRGEMIEPFTTGNFSLENYPLEIGLNIIKATAEKKHVNTYYVSKEVEVPKTIIITEEVMQVIPVTAEETATEEETAETTKTVLTTVETTAITMETVTTFEPFTTITYEVVASDEVRVFRYKPFSDVYVEHWAVEPIAYVSTFGIIKGYPDGTFQPKKGITRAELITLLMRTLQEKDWEHPSREASAFKDVADSHWALPYIQEAVKMGITKGYPDKTFKPKAILTRAEAITILTRFADISVAPEEVVAQPFTDVPTTHWVNPFLQQAKAAGLLEYLGSGEFQPRAEFTRAEATEVLFRTSFMQDKVEKFWEEGLK